MIIYSIWGILLVLVAIKAMVIGSEFSIHYWFRDGRKYTDWYNNRQTYTGFLECQYEDSTYNLELGRLT